MTSSIERQKGTRRCRVRWREGGRGSKQRRSKWFADKRMAVDFQQELDRRQEETREVGNRLILPWSEVRSKWLATLKGRYRTESRRTLERHTKTWTSTASATPAAMSVLPIGTARVARRCVRWAWLIHNQPMDPRAMKVQAKRVRPKRAKPDLPTDERVIELIDKAATWSAGNGALCHVIALYSTRAESLVGLDGGADFDNERGRLKFLNKNGEIEWQILAPWTCAVLRALKPQAGKPLFLNHLGKAWKTGQEFSSWFHHNIGEGTGYKVLLRCSSMTRLLELAGDAKTAANVSKHLTPSLITNTYALDSEVKERELVGKVAERMAKFAGPRLVDKAD